MKFGVKTEAPSGISPIQKKADTIKSLLFEAVSLYVEDDEPARQELLSLLNRESEAKAS